MSGSFFDHAVDFVLVEARRRFDGDLLFLACAEVFCRNVYDAVGVDVEGDFDTRYSTGSSRDAGQFKAAEGLVVGCHFTFALKDVDVDRRLVIDSCREDLAAGSRDRRVAVDDLGEDTAEGFNAQRKRRNVEEQYVFDIADEDTGLDSCADSDTFIGVDAFARFFAEDGFDGILDSRDTAGTADEDDLVDFVDGVARVSDGFLGRFHRSLDEVFRQFVEFSTGQGQIEVFRARSISRDEGQVDIGREDRGQFDLSFFSSFLEALFSHLILREVDARFFLEFADHPFHDFVIEVIAAEVRVAVGSLYFEDAVAEFEDGHIESTAAEVEYEDLAVAAFIEAISQGCCRRFVDDTENVEAGDLTSIFGSLALAVVEVCRNGDDGLGDFFAEVAFSVFLQFLKDHSGNFLRCIFLALDVYGVVFTHVAFNGRNGVFRVGYGLTFCQLADEAFARLGEADDRRCEARAFRIRDDRRFAAFHNSYYGVCCT